MTHPHVLHARAALWSLHAALQALRQQATAAATEATDGLQAWRPQIGRAIGGHGDPASGAALTLTAGTDRWARLATSTAGTLRWLAGRLAGEQPGISIQRLAAAIPTLPPATAAELARWLVEADERIRRTLGMPPDLWPLPGTPACPACAVRRLSAWTAAPNARDWTVICGARCVCTGDGCPCGMAVQVAGVEHIWPRAAVIGAAAGTRKLPHLR